MKARKAFVWVLGITIAGAVAVIGLTSLSDATVGGNREFSRPVTPELIARGAYLAQMGDCAACHSVSGKPEFAGGLKMAIPIGAIYTSNITPDKEYGIGSYSLADFDRALRFGVAGGHTLYPAMPFPSYANSRPEDVDALYAYFMHGVAAAAVPNRPNDIAFPLSLRFPLTLWRWAFAPTPKPFPPAAAQDPVAVHGAYFVEGLGHCGDCHTPRAQTLQVEAQTSTDGPAFLAGAAVEHWFAPSLRNGGPGTIGDWSEAEIAQFLKTGTNRHGIAFGSMVDVIEHSTQFLSDADAAAAAHYLKTITGSDPAAGFAYDEKTHRALMTGDASRRGAQLYLDNCAACHRPDGRGYDGVFPALADNPVVEAQDPVSLVHIILRGMKTPRTAATPAQFAMPAFDWRLSDQDLADLVTFIRTSWGNRGFPIDRRAAALTRRETTN